MWRDFPRAFCEAHGLAGFVFSRYGYGRSTAKPSDERWAPDFMHRAGGRSAAGAVRARSASSGPGCSATATAARSRCCMRRAIRSPASSRSRRTCSSRTSRSPASRRRATPTRRPTCARASRATTPTPTRRSAAGTTSGSRRRSAHWNIETRDRHDRLPGPRRAGRRRRVRHARADRCDRGAIAENPLARDRGLRTLAASRPARDPLARGRPLHPRTSVPLEPWSFYVHHASRSSRARRDARRRLVRGAGAGQRPDQGRPDAPLQRHLRRARQRDRERLQALRPGAGRQARRARDPVLQGRRRVRAAEGDRQRQQADQARQRRRPRRHRALGRRAGDGQGGQGQQHAARHPERRRRRDHRADVRRRTSCAARSRTGSRATRWASSPARRASSGR